MEPMEDDPPLPITDRIERILALLSVARDELSLVTLQERTREQEALRQRRLRAQRKSGTPASPGEPLRNTG